MGSPDDAETTSSPNTPRYTSAGGSGADRIAGHHHLHFEGGGADPEFPPPTIAGATVTQVDQSDGLLITLDTGDTICIRRCFGMYVRGELHQIDASGHMDPRLQLLHQQIVRAAAITSSGALYISFNDYAIKTTPIGLSAWQVHLADGTLYYSLESGGAGILHRAPLDLI